MRLDIIHSDDAIAKWLSYHISSAFECFNVGTFRSAIDWALDRDSEPFPSIVVADLDSLEKQPGARASDGVEKFRARMCKAGGGESNTYLIITAKKSDEFVATRCMQAGANDYCPTYKLNGTLLERMLSRALSFTVPELPADGSLLPRIEEKAPSVDGYQMIRELGEGGQATVYLARSEELDENVVLKVIHGEKRALIGGREVRQFVQECNLLSRLNTPKIVDIYDFGETRELLFIAMEFFPCGDLRMRMANPVSPAGALHYAKGIAEALAIVHSHNILHRDLKPQNVMLREDNSVALIDFGIAKSTKLSADTISMTGEIKGSPFYLSPEAIDGGDMGPSADLYSLGVILFELLAGRRPYGADNVAALLTQHLTAPVPDLPVSVKSVQPLIELLLEKNASKRVDDANEVIRQIQALESIFSDDTPATAA